jgi:muconolactone delta-isomerase
MPDSWDIIDEIAAELGHNANARRMWRERGVPAYAALDILDIAHKRRMKLTRADIPVKATHARRKPKGNAA